MGWSDDVGTARDQVERAIAEAGGEDTLLLTDMFGGTPTNLSLPFLSAAGRDRHRGQPAHAHQAHEPPGRKAGRGGAPGPGPGEGRDLRGERRPGEEAGLIRRRLSIRNRLGLHARAAARFVHTASALPVEGDGLARREDDGRQVDPRPPAPGRRPGSRDRDRGRRRATRRRPSRRSSPWSRAASEKRGERAPGAGPGQGMELKGTGVSPGHRGGAVPARRTRRGARVSPPGSARGDRGRGRPPDPRHRGLAPASSRPSRTECRARSGCLTPTSSTPTCSCSRIRSCATARSRSSARSTSTRSGRCGWWPSSCTRSSTPSRTQYLRERSTDLDDVLGRIQLNLAGAGDAPSLSRLPGRFVVVAGGLSPSEAAGLDWERVVAIATDVGSSTYHTAIIARSLGIPAVVGLEDATRRIPPGTLVVVDGTRGRVVVEPSGPALAGLREAQEREAREERRLQETRALPAVTLDGTVVALRANVEFIEEVATARLYGAQGIGLFRSEYLLGRSRRWPTEERAARRLPKAPGADGAPPGHGQDLGRRPRRDGPRGTDEPEPRARRAGAPAPPPVPGALSHPGTGTPARPGPRTRCG